MAFFTGFIEQLLPGPEKESAIGVRYLELVIRDSYLRIVQEGEGSVFGE